MTKLFTDSRRHSDVFKYSVAFIVKKPVTRRAKDTRRAIVSRGRSGVTIRTIRNRKICIVDDHQIEPSVAIVIEERRARAPARIVGPTLPGDIDKLSVTFIQIHLIRTEIREV